MTEKKTVTPGCVELLADFVDNVELLEAHAHALEEIEELVLDSDESESQKLGKIITLHEVRLLVRNLHNELKGGVGQ